MIERATAPDAGTVVGDGEARKVRTPDKRGESKRTEDAAEATAKAAESKKAAREGPDQFIRRAIDAKKRATSNPELQRELTKLINDLSIAPRDITAADQDLVRRAETE